MNIHCYFITELCVWVRINKVFHRVYLYRKLIFYLNFVNYREIERHNYIKKLAIKTHK